MFVAPMDDVPIALQRPDPMVVIRPVQIEDVETLHGQCWTDRPLSAVYQLVSRAKQVAQQGRGLGIVVTGGNRTDIRGYGQLTLWPRTAEVSDLVVNDAYRGQGLGTAMIQYLVRAAKEMHAPMVEIGVAYSNPGALALYRRLGFEDSHTIMLNLGQGLEEVLYLKLDLNTETTQRKTS